MTTLPGDAAAWAAWAASTTLDGTLVPSAVKGVGTEREYRGLARAAGEPYLRRLELAPGAPASGPRTPGPRTSLLHLVHLTDLQIVDVRSPARIEFIERRSERIALARLLPAHRAHESLSLLALGAIVRTIRALSASPVTGAPVELAVTTGDAVDNQQWNELTWFLTSMEGGEVAAGSGAGRFDGVQSAMWGDDAYWDPEGGANAYSERWGFPAYPGLLRDASHPFRTPGIGLPWLACFGNHEGLLQGMALPTEAVRSIAIGDRKAADLPPDFDPTRSVERFVTHPEDFLAGPARPVPADPARRLFTRREFIEAHFRPSGSPTGHGFTDENLRAATAYYVYDDVPGVRLIVLDTSVPGGFADGSLGAVQAAWLEARLAEVHARYVDATGDAISTGAPDRLVVLFSHHGLETLSNVSTFENPFDPDGQDLPRLGAPHVRELLHRFANVVLWVNGHTHEHRVYARPDPTGWTAGFWEVSTGAVMDWPSQARLVELVENGNGTLSIFCTLVDHAGPPDPQDASAEWRLASIHRELASNDPELGASSSTAGEPSDRNVELLLPVTFPAGRHQ